MSLLSVLFGRAAPKKPPQDPYWQRNDDLRYPRLLQVFGKSGRITGMGGVFITWSVGTKGRWFYCGHGKDLAECVRLLMDDEIFEDVPNRGSLFFTWAPIKEELRDGTVRYLRETLPFMIDDPGIDQSF
ncbi:MAG: hypothetical protein ACPGYL_15740, partial [Rhodospirillaceae bacterium]